MNRCVSGSVRGIAFMSALGVFPIFADSDVGTKNLEGFFIGVDAAYSHSSLRNDNAWAVMYGMGRQIGDGEPGSIYKNKRSCVDPSVNIGYGRFFGNWYFGLAGDVSFGKSGNSYVVTDSVSKVGYEAKIDGVSYSVKVKGGYYFGELSSVLYGIAGLRWRDVSYRNFVDGNFSSKSKLKTPIFVLGVGFEHPVCEKLSLSAEYECSWRSSSSRNDLTAYHLTLSTSMKQKVREHTVRIGVKYHI